MTDILAGSRHLWDGHARRDPLWAILSDPAKKGGRWDLQRFFQTGVGEISLILYRLRSHGVAVEQRRALDFGCGVGRLSQSLALHFARVDGVDISPAMIDLARSLNRHGERVSYHANDRPDLSLFADGTFDFIVTSIVLQHIESVIASSYLAELCRVLAAGGAIVFQVPARERALGDPPAAVRGHGISDMPDEAYRAVLSVTGAPASEMGPGEERLLEVDVLNASAFEWSQGAFGVIRAGNHWFDASGYAMVIADDGRTGVPEPLYPGDRSRVALTITAPRDCGDYWCEIDLAHEGVVWFCERGSAAVRFPVRVLKDRERRDGDGAVREALLPLATQDPAAEISTAYEQLTPAGMTGDGSDAEPDEFPMFAIPQDEVLAILAAGSVEVIAIEDDRSCGDDWISFRYFARKLSVRLSPRAASVPRH